MLRSQYSQREEETILKDSLEGDPEPGRRSFSMKGGRESIARSDSRSKPLSFSKGETRLKSELLGEEVMESQAKEESRESRKTWRTRSSAHRPLGRDATRYQMPVE